MTSYKKIMPIFLTAALIGTAAFSLSNRKDLHDKYELAITEARDYAEKGIVSDSIAKYQEAISADPRLEAYLEAGNVYMANNDLRGAEKWYSGNLKSAYPKAPETYLFGIELYLARDDYDEVFEIYNEYKDRELFSQEVEDLLDPIRYSYCLLGEYEQVGAYSSVNKMTPTEYKGKWGYINGSSDRKINYYFKEAGFYSTYAAVVDGEDNAYYIDTNGNVKVNETVILTSDPDFGKVVRFGTIQSDMYMAYNGSFWNYYDMSTTEKKFGGFKEATPIANGVGAVSMDGGKWAIIASDGSLVTDYIYDEVLADDKGVICRTGSIFVKQDGQYFMIDSAGKRVGSDVYEAAYPFVTETSAAVKLNGKWSFIDPQGNVLLTTDYDNAKSFSFNLAPVEADGKWGYIDASGEIAIECVFEDANTFNKNGTAFVEKEDGVWSLLSLYQYNH